MVVVHLSSGVTRMSGQHRRPAVDRRAGGLAGVLAGVVAGGFVFIGADELRAARADELMSANSHEEKPFVEGCGARNGTPRGLTGARQERR